MSNLLLEFSIHKPQECLGMLMNVEREHRANIPRFCAALGWHNPHAAEWSVRNCWPVTDAVPATQGAEACPALGPENASKTKPDM